MDDKITIVEGPPPTFVAVQDSWLLGLHEGNTVGNIVVTHLRTLNGPTLVERCHHAWSNRLSIELEYRSSEGLTKHAPIVAARNVETPEGHLLILWVRLSQEEAEMALGFEDDGDDGE
jgi:hypothetical protein